MKNGMFSIYEYINCCRIPSINSMEVINLSWVGWCFSVVTNRIITCLVGDSYRPWFATPTGKGDNPSMRCISQFEEKFRLWQLYIYIVRKVRENLSILGFAEFPQRYLIHHLYAYFAIMSPRLAIFCHKECQNLKKTMTTMDLLKSRW